MNDPAHNKKAATSAEAEPKSRREYMLKQSTGCASTRNMKRLSPRNHVTKVILSLLLVVLSGFKAVDASYAISVDPGSEECYIFMIPKGAGNGSTVT